MTHLRDETNGCQKIAAIVLGVLLILVVISAIPSILESNYFAKVNKITDQMENGVHLPNGEICDAKYVVGMGANAYCKLSLSEQLQIDNSVDEDLEDFLKKRYSELQLFKDNVKADPVGECTWMKQNLSEFRNLVEGEFNSKEWRELRVMITEHQKAWWDNKCTKVI